MARLEFAGARYVRNYHLAVPHHELEIDKKKSFENPRLSKAGAGSIAHDAGGFPSLEDNLIIHGDNLKALKSLLPHFAGRVKCIYIDPPYNTGNEKWVYNDNVNSPRHKDWLNKVVDKDCQDRHDRWLSMMMPRLKLLRELLRDDGVIFISIDDNEQHHLRMMMDEIFGEQNFVANVIWEKKFAPQNDARYFSDNHDFILVYGKSLDGSAGWKRNLLPRTEEMNARYSNPDNDTRGPWMSGDMTVKTFTPSTVYTIKTPSGRKVDPPEGTCWRFSKDKYNELVADNRIWFGEDGNNVPRVKRFLSDVQGGLVPLTIWPHKLVGHNQEAKQELRSILPEAETLFETPKPVRLLKHILQIGSDKDSIIIDSMAGSGTTAHAVLALNKEDGGNRKFILVEQEDYADTITAERVRRVIKGVKTAKDENLKNGLGGSFTYVTLGQEFDMEKMLSGENLPSYETMAAYCYLTAIGKPWEKSGMRKRDRFIGTSDEYDVYLFYEPDVEKLKSKDLALALDWVEEQEESPKKKKLVFAPVRFVSRENMEKYGLEYCQLPYEIYRKVEEKTATNTEKKK